MKKTVLTLSLMGLAFSGYMSGVKFFTDTCAFGETCPYFLGYPACYFGFAMFFVLAALAVQFFFGWIRERFALGLIASVAALGTVFAGSFALPELPTLLERGVGAYVFGLPTCVLGLVFYLMILLVSLLSARSVAER